MINKAIPSNGNIRRLKLSTSLIQLSVSSLPALQRILLFIKTFSKKTVERYSQILRKYIFLPYKRNLMDFLYFLYQIYIATELTTSISLNVFYAEVSKISALPRNNPSRTNHARKNQVTFSLSSARSKNGFGAGRCVRGKKHLSRGSRRLVERGVCVHGMEGRTQRKGLSRGFQRRAEVSIRYQIKW